MTYDQITNQLEEIRAERKEWAEGGNDFEYDIKAIDEVLKILDEFKIIHPVPAHYEVEGLEQDTMDIIIALVKHNTSDVEAACYFFSILKYLFRFGKKNGKDDLLKALDFLYRLLEVES